MECHLRIRLTPELREKFRASARKHHRSMQGEVVVALENYLEDKKASELTDKSRSDASRVNQERNT